MTRWILVFMLLYTVVGLPSQGEEDDNIDVRTTDKPLIEGILSYAKSIKGSPLPPRNDLVFILDSSSAVGGQRNFRSLQIFTQRLVSEFSVSSSTTRVGVILCSSHPYLHFGLDKFVNRECTLKAVRNASMV
ncbi:hypothetical protein QZH41_002904 [Actinostola sp. cb2023]|nr:hypothetical protein QZH41_002904 [Actinostola sp. cb2023]